MNVWDERILEIAANDEDGAVSVRELDEHDLIRTSRSTISRRCKRLAEHSLLRQIAQGAYIITDEGRAYLDEEYDAETETYLEENEADDGPPAVEEANGA